MSASTILLSDVTIEEVSIKALEPTPITLTYTAFNDQVSKSYDSSTQLCGYTTYTVLEESKADAAPSFIKANYVGGEESFQIVVDAKNQANPTSLDLFLRGSLVDYPNEVPLDLPFTVTILEADKSNAFDTSGLFDVVEEEVEEEPEPEPEPEVEVETPEFTFVPDFDFLKP